MPQTLTARAILERLVAFPTVSSDTNLPLIDWVEDYLAGHGVRAARVYSDCRTKAGLFATIGPDVPGGVILSGHTDVVPTQGQPWDSDPFEVIEKSGRLYGRGTCDMKGFDAIALAAVPKALAAPLKRPIHLALSYDEEVGCTGAPRLIDAMMAQIAPPCAAIIGEPSMMQAVTGHKGSLGIETHVRGFEVHSSLMHKGVSAVMEAAKLIHWANRANERNAAQTPGALDALFEPPWTTAHVGRIHGGTADNITARDCKFTLAFRAVPSETTQEWHDAYLAEVARIETEMKAVHPEARIDTNVVFDVPGLKPENMGEAEAIVRRLTGDNATHQVSYATEAGQFQGAGVSSVICGPGDIAQAHQPNEFIDISQLEAGVSFMDRLIKDLSI